MNIHELKEKIKANKRDVSLVSIFVLASLLSFGLGRLSAIFDLKMPLKIENGGINPLNLDQNKAEATQGAIGQNYADTSSSGANSQATSPSNQAGKGEKLFVASKSGTKYYYPWCSGVARIKEENKIWFASADEANKAGYSPASNCKGLQ